MAKSSASTVDDYLAELPPERREVVAQVRDLVNRHLPRGYEERLSWGMISWEVPLSRYPTTYNKQPLAFVALAAQKNHYALYLMCAYADSSQEAALRKAYAQAGKKFDFGKSCLRFKGLDDLLAEPVGELIAGTPVEAHIAHYEASRVRN